MGAVLGDCLIGPKELELDVPLGTDLGGTLLVSALLVRALLVRALLVRALLVRALLVRALLVSLSLLTSCFERQFRNHEVFVQKLWQTA